LQYEVAPARAILSERSAKYVCIGLLQLNERHMLEVDCRGFFDKVLFDGIASTSRATQQSDGASDLEIASWLPMSVKQAVIKKAYFLFDKEYERADGALRKRLLDDLKEAKKAGEKIVIVWHSMGTMVAYDVARNCPECPTIDTLITIGSPDAARCAFRMAFRIAESDIASFAS
jgi:pimeloyl-ACP methyl ester carboxylesterase